MNNAELKKFCRDNWNKVEQNKRQLCINHLRGVIPPEVIAQWKKDGYDIAVWHFYGGMAVRNALRDVMKDDELPGVPYPRQDDLVKNWDDYYTGAIDELLEQVD